MTRETRDRLVRCALEARRNAYVPYSHWAVGAALLAEDGTLFPGCNVENAAYGPTNCAERTALFSAVAQGKRRFLLLRLPGVRKGNLLPLFVRRCGVCRQALAEFCSPDFEVLLVQSEEKTECYTLGELLPLAFTPASLNGEGGTADENV